MNLLHFILDTNRARAEAIRRELEQRGGENDNPTTEQPKPAQPAEQEVEL
jgi:hypothetical protein